MIAEEINAQWLAGQMQRVQRAMSERDWELADGYVDVRLQATEHDGWLHVGDASCDMDHTRYWGSGTLTPDQDFSDLLEMAEAMITEAAEMASESDSHQSDSIGSTKAMTKTPFHVYAEDGFESAHRSAAAAIHAAKCGQARRRVSYCVFKCDAYGLTGSGHGAKVWPVADAKTED